MRCVESASVEGSIPLVLKTNDDILGELRRRRITVTALAKEMGWNRQTLSARLNNRGRPDATFKGEVIAAIERLKEQ